MTVETSWDNLQPHTWVALGDHTQALLLNATDQFVALLYWMPAGPAEAVSGAKDGDLLVLPAEYSLVACHEPRDSMAIATEPEGAQPPDGPDWPNQLLSQAALAYFEQWGG